MIEARPSGSKSVLVGCTSISAKQAEQILPRAISSRLKNRSQAKLCCFGLPLLFFDPRGRPTVIKAGRDHCFCTCHPSVRPQFSKQNKFQEKTILATGETVGLAEWIIDDTCLVFLSFFQDTNKTT